MLASVQRGLGAAFAQRGGEMTIRLAPEGMGSLKISMSVSEGSVAASFKATTPEASRLLKGQLEALRESFEARGLRVDRLTVSGPTQPASASADADGARHEQAGARRDQGGDGSDGRSKGRGEGEHSRDGNGGRRGRGKDDPAERFMQKWRLALDATA